MPHAVYDQEAQHNIRWNRDKGYDERGGLSGSHGQRNATENDQSTKNTIKITTASPSGTMQTNANQYGQPAARKAVCQAIHRYDGGYKNKAEKCRADNEHKRNECDSDGSKKYTAGRVVSPEKDSEKDQHNENAEGS